MPEVQITPAKSCPYGQGQFLGNRKLLGTCPKRADYFSLCKVWLFVFAQCFYTAPKHMTNLHVRTQFIEKGPA